MTTEYKPGERIVITEGDFAGTVATIQEVQGQMLRVLTDKGLHTKWVFDFEVKPLSDGDCI